MAVYGDDCQRLDGLTHTHLISQQQPSMSLYAERQRFLLKIIEFGIKREDSRLYFSLHFAIVDGLRNRIVHILNLQFQLHILRCFEHEVGYFLNYDQ